MSAALIAFCLPGAAIAWDGGLLVPRIAREAPDLSDYPGADGLVWLHEERYELNPDGSMAQHSKWLILLDRNAPEELTDWTIPVPPGGSASVEESALYTLPMGTMAVPLVPEERPVEGARSIRVRVPPLEGTRVLALGYSRTFPGRCNLEDAFWIRGAVPQWEQRVVVDVPRNTPIYWDGNREVLPPSREERGAVDRYTWKVVNAPPLRRDSLLRSELPVLAFSLRSDLATLIGSLDGLSDGVERPADVAADYGRGRGDARDRGKRLIKALSREEHLLPGFPGTFVRPRIPSGGPWTEWERSFVIGEALKELGWEVGYRWLPLLPREDSSPAARRAWAPPILFCKPPRGGAFHVVPGQRVEVGERPSRLYGETLYYRDGASYGTTTIPRGEVEDHRLTLEWELDLAVDGSARGTLDVFVRNGWVDVVGRGRNGESAVVPLEGMERVALGPPEVQGLSYGYRLTLPVELSLAIPGRKGLLVTLPSMTVPQLAEARNSATPVALRFPFVLEQKVTLTLPDGYSVMTFPAATEQGGAIALRERFGYRGKRESVYGESRLIVKTSTVGTSEERSWRQRTGRWLQWGNHTIPVEN